MKQLIKYIEEGLLGDMRDVLADGDNLQIIFDKANKELDKIAKDISVGSKWKKFKRPLYDYSGNSPIRIGDETRYSFKASCCYVGEYLGNKGRHLTIVVSIKEGEVNDDKSDWTVQIILEPDDSNKPEVKYSTINTIFNLPLSKFRTHKHVIKDIVSKFSSIDIFEKFLSENPEIISYYYERS